MRLWSTQMLNEWSSAQIAWHFNEITTVEETCDAERDEVQYLCLGPIIQVVMVFFLYSRVSI